MINFQYLNIFESMFPGLNLTDAAIAYWVFTAQQVAKEAVIYQNRRYIVITAGMIRAEIPMMKGVTDRTVRTILSRLTETGVLERTRAKKAGTAYAYIASNRFVMSLNIKPENFSHRKSSDTEDFGKKQVEENFRLQVEKNAGDNLLQYTNYNVNTQVEENFRLKTSKNLPEKYSTSPTRSSRKPSKSKEIDNAFEQFWASYPKHKNKAEAKRRFVRLKLHRRIDELLEAVKNYCADDGIRRNLLEGHLEYVKNPETFLLTRGVEYWLDWIGGGAVLNRAALSEPNGGESDGGVKVADDPSVADFVGRMELAFAKMGDERDPEASLSDTVGEFFSEDEISVMEAENWRVPFVYEEYTKDRYARFILDKLREGGSHDGAA